MKRPPKSRKHTRRIHLALLVALVSIQCALSLGLVNLRPDVSRGFLVKSGNGYSLFWQQEGKYWEQNFANLNGALDFADRTLSLGSVSNHLAAQNIERLWVQDRAGRFQLFWKTHHLPYLFRWTFDSQSDVQYFAKAFQTGSYSGSVFGHSVLLLPIENTR